MAEASHRIAVIADAESSGARRYGVAAVALGQLPPHGVLQHQEVVMAVACQAQARRKHARARARRVRAPFFKRKNGASILR